MMKSEMKKYFAFHKNDQLREKEFFSSQKWNSQRKLVFAQKCWDQRRKKILSQNEISERKSMRGNAGKIRKFILPVLTQEIFDNFSLQPVQSANQINIYNGPIFLIYYVHIFLVQRGNRINICVVSSAVSKIVRFPSIAGVFKGYNFLNCISVFEEQGLIGLYFL